MDSIKISGGRRLCGTVQISGSKNAALPILAATAAIHAPCVIRRCPNIRDVEAAAEILRCLGCCVTRSGDTVTVDASCRDRAAVPEDLSLQMRSSVLFLGALTGAHSDASIYMPGGCVLGSRPIDLHISGLQKLGAAVTIEGSRINCCAKRLTGGAVFLPYPSVGATENLMLAAIGASSPVTILGAAREPEIVDLAAFLTACGASVIGAGTSAIRIAGGDLHGAEYTVMPDRMEAVTYLSAAASAGGDLTVSGVIPQHFAPILQTLRSAGCLVSATQDSVRLQCDRLHAASPVLTGPYPAFPTDAQPTVMAALLKADGVSVFAETVFENRFRHVPALRSLGAQIEIAGAVAAVHGVPCLHGAAMSATDLRGGAAMLVAALAADGTSTIDCLHHMERGYEDLPQKLRAVGAQIEEAADCCVTKEK